MVEECGSQMYIAVVNDVYVYAVFGSLHRTFDGSSTPNLLSPLNELSPVNTRGCFYNGCLVCVPRRVRTAFSPVNKLESFAGDCDTSVPRL